MSLDVAGRYRYPAPDPDWLSRREEPVIWPDAPILDAHHHIWREPGNAYLLDDVLADLTSGHRVVASVFVQAHFAYDEGGPEPLRCVGETRAVAAMRRQARDRDAAPDVAAAIVAYADLTLGAAVSEVLDAHLAVEPQAMRGVRCSVSNDPNFPNGIVLRPAPPGLLADPRYREGLATLAAYGLSYDAMLYHVQIRELAAAADAVPALPIVLDHLGCPLGVGVYEGHEREVFAAWRADMAELARRPNVHVKLGGRGMIICGARWHEASRPPSSVELARAWAPYIETCIDLFGPARCMFESNFPVDKAMASYVTVWNAFKRLAEGYSADERHALLHDTAATFYRLPRLKAPQTLAPVHAEPG